MTHAGSGGSPKRAKGRRNGGDGIEDGDDVDSDADYEEGGAGRQGVEFALQITVALPDF